jgi:hypothetical protein
MEELEVVDQLQMSLDKWHIDPSEVLHFVLGVRVEMSHQLPTMFETYPSFPIEMDPLELQSNSIEDLRYYND